MKVLNKYKHGFPPGSVYIGRPSKWGNPFMLNKDGNRDQVLEKYRAWLLGNPELIRQMRNELYGKDLVCFCWPKKCHGDVIIEILTETVSVK